MPAPLSLTFKKLISNCGGIVVSASKLHMKLDRFRLLLGEVKQICNSSQLERINKTVKLTALQKSCWHWWHLACTIKQTNKRTPLLKNIPWTIERLMFFVSSSACSLPTSVKTHRVIYTQKIYRMDQSPQAKIQILTTKRKQTKFINDNFKTERFSKHVSKGV